MEKEDPVWGVAGLVSLRIRASFCLFQVTPLTWCFLLNAYEIVRELSFLNSFINETRNPERGLHFPGSPKFSVTL